MQTPAAPPDAGWSQWIKILAPAGVVAVTALLWGWIRPMVAKLIIYFLKDDAGQLFFKEYFRDTMRELLDEYTVEIATTTSAVRAMQRDVQRVELTVAGQTKMVEEVCGDVKAIRSAVDQMMGREQARYYSPDFHPHRRETDGQ